MAALEPLRTLAGDDAPCTVGACDEPRAVGRVMCATHWASLPLLLQQLLEEATAELNDGRTGAQKRYLDLVRAARTAIEKPGQQLALPLRS